MMSSPEVDSTVYKIREEDAQAPHPPPPARRHNVLVCLLCSSLQALEYPG